MNRSTVEMDVEAFAPRRCETNTKLVTESAGSMDLSRVTCVDPKIDTVACIGLARIVANPRVLASYLDLNRQPARIPGRADVMPTRPSVERGEIGQPAGFGEL
jgi:hypothetical protein